MDLKEISDKKKFWKRVKRLFSGKSKSKSNITIEDNENVVTEKGKGAEILKKYVIELRNTTIYK